MNSYVLWAAVWLGVIAAGFFIADHLTRQPPVVSLVTEGTQELTIPVSRDGHYYVKGAINGVPLTYMIDTGASYVSVGEDFARAARLPQGTTGYFNTANGTVAGKIVKDQVVEADAFRVSGLSVAVTPLQGGTALLGQNFLRRFDVSQAAGVMRLRLSSASASKDR
jgi:aspartyl protease family protein